MRGKILIICFLCWFSQLHAQSWKFARDIGYWEDYNPQVTADLAGGFYLATSFQGDTAWGASFSSNLRKGYVTRVDRNGNPLWLQKIEGSNTRIKSVISFAGGVLVHGICAYDLVLSDTSLVTPGTWMSFIVSYDNTGRRKWVAIEKLFNALACDYNGNMYIARHSPSINSLYITRLDPDGQTAVWTKQYLTNCGLVNLQCTPSGNLLLMVQGNNTLFFESHRGPAGNPLSYLASIDPAGKVTGCEKIAGAYISDFEADKNGSLYVTGVYHDTATVGGNTFIAEESHPYYQEYFMAKLTQGSCEWLYKKVQTSSELLMDVTPAGDVYCTGNFGDSISLGGFTLHNYIGAYNPTFVIKINTQGAGLWGMQNNGGNLFANQQSGIASNERGEVMIAGSYHNNTEQTRFGEHPLPPTSTNTHFFAAGLSENCPGNAKVSVTPDVMEVCLEANTTDLPVGSPAGGYFRGPGVYGSRYKPSNAGEGWHTIEYVYPDTAGCTGVAIARIHIKKCPVTGIPENPVELTMEIAPNPAENYCSIRLAGHDGNIRLSLYNTMGQRVLSRELAQEQETAVDLAGLGKGIYLLEAESRNGTVKRKLVVK